LPSTSPNGRSSPQETVGPPKRIASLLMFAPTTGRTLMCREPVARSPDRACRRLETALPSFTVLPLGKKRHQCAAKGPKITTVLARKGTPLADNPVCPDDTTILPPPPYLGLVVVPVSKRPHDPSPGGTPPTRDRRGAPLFRRGPNHGFPRRFPAAPGCSRSRSINDKRVAVPPTSRRR